MWNMKIDSNAEKLIDLFRSAGFVAFVVGGPVRDMIMGHIPSDWDICTAAKPNEIIDILSDAGIRYFDSGLKHGTVSAVIEGSVYEITTFRTETGYADHRHPDEVKFIGDIEGDLARRDFTVNAMAYNCDTGVIDLFGGKSDIENKLIKCVGDPHERFEEDALRILRALRFSSVLGFSIDSETSKAIFAKKDLLKNISSERIRDELLKILCGKNVRAVLEEYVRVFGVFIPEILPLKDVFQNHPYHFDDAWTHTVRAVESIKAQPVLRVAALFHDLGKVKTKTTDETGTDHFYSHPKVGEDMAREVLNRLRFSKFEIRRICALIANHDREIIPNRKYILRTLNKLGEEVFEDLLELKRADICAQSAEFYESSMEKLTAVEQVYKSVKTENLCFSLADLAIDGEILRENGYKGKEIGEKLKELLNLVIEGKVPNKLEELLKHI